MTLSDLLTDADVESMEMTLRLANQIWYYWRTDENK